MNIIVNGKTIPVEMNTTVAQLLQLRGLTTQRVAVERNGSIVPKSAHVHTVLAAGDHVELVVAVGGG